MLDLIIKNGKIVDGNNIVEGDILVAGGKVVGVTRRGEIDRARRVLDAEGRYVLPGAIDSHSHLGQMPGAGQPKVQGQEENFMTESSSALYGGVTSALNYIFTQESLEKVFPRFIELVKRHSLIDIKFHGALMNQVHLDNIERYIHDLGITSFKIFLPYKGAEAANLGGLSSLNDGQILEAFVKLKEYGGLPMIHAENPELIDYYSRRLTDPTRQDMASWEATRPGICEGEAVAKVLYLARKVGCRIGIAHVSSKEAVECIQEARDQEVVLETCPHYLALTVEAGLGSLGKVSPPIRHHDDREKIWEAVEKQVPVIIGSDHNSWVTAHKQELWSGLAGLPGNAVIMAVLFTEGVNKRGLSPLDVVRVSSYNAAKLFGLFPAKGTLAVGSDADITIMETGIKKYLDPSETGSIVDYTPYQNYLFTAWPYAVIARGEVMVLDGRRENSEHRGNCLNTFCLNTVCST
ncbi:dihydroorotase [Thermanaeromonas sp. C210]|uniref:dihydroorotase n=1 Tax=Thermanaeromonas sp. C210 TaxID=2731925 RepID=UPI00155C9A9A|nr:amidohydrolase family protein [Thermanaeromonas sp. C210]GFN22364.1 dihydroorotase-like protein [Thermanaeromonas sp. C210]